MPSVAMAIPEVDIRGTMRSTIYPADQLTLSDQKAARELAMRAAVAQYLNRVGGRAEELYIRAFENILDAGTALDQWNTAALAVVGTAYSVFQAIAAPVLANNKVAVFYGVAVEQVPFPVSLLTFRSGGAAGNIIAEFDLEQLVNAEQPVGFFAHPILINPTDTFAVQVLCRLVAPASRVQLMAYIVEPKGQRVSIQ